ASSFVYFTAPAATAATPLSLHDALPIYACAASTRRMIPDSAVSSPTAETRTRRLPPATTVPPRTRAPVSFEAAFDSPVIVDSSRSEEHTSELQSLRHLVCRLLLEKKKIR